MTRHRSDSAAPTPTREQLVVDAVMADLRGRPGIDTAVRVVEMMRSTLFKLREACVIADEELPEQIDGSLLDEAGFAVLAADAFLEDAAAPRVPERDTPGCRLGLCDGSGYRTVREQAEAFGPAHDYTFREVAYSLFYPSVVHEPDDPLSRELQTAIFTMGQAISAPYHGAYVADPPPLLASDAKDRWEHRRVVQAKPQQRDALSALVEIVQRALAEARASGVRRGRSLLLGLASGDVSTTAFDAAVEKVGRR